MKDREVPMAELLPNQTGIAEIGERGCTGISTEESRNGGEQEPATQPGRCTLSGDYHNKVTKIIITPIEPITISTIMITLFPSFDFEEGIF
ncbi:MAG: hypothetical protein LBM06_07955 [Prevotellaceae bacterium]|nr:hypothetical protein [Prevotellaceae bacterium]